MTRPEYINLLNANSHLYLVYIFYKEECSKSNEKPLDLNMFLLCFNMWEDCQMYTRLVLKHYAKEFEPIILTDKTGRLVRFL